MKLIGLKNNHRVGSLHDAIQQAIEIEITTIPLYLYTYYTIHRVPKQEAIIAYYTRKLMDRVDEKGNRMSEEEVCKKAKDLSIKVMVFANKAAATIMSVVVEEMLHMALSSNLQAGVGGMPMLAGRAPKSFPTILPGHAKVKGQEFLASLAPLSEAQLDVFLKIEQPDHSSEKNGNDIPLDDYTSIGQFYNRIKDYIEENDEKINWNNTNPQLYPDKAYNRKGYYAPNNVNTIYYDEDHKPVFTNANANDDPDHAGHLIKVVDKESAKKAIEEIIHQGEGANHEHEDGTEDSHYGKFLEIKKELGDYRNYLKDEMGVPETEIETEYENLLSFFITPAPVNPQTADYPPELQALSNYVNALYTYHFYMTEACYRFPNPKQGAIMLYGLHKSMFFILSVICSFMMTKTYRDKDGVLKQVAPTFEEYQFKAGQNVKKQLIELNKQVPDCLGMTPNQLARISDLPDIDIAAMENMKF